MSAVRSAEPVTESVTESGAVLSAERLRVTYGGVTAVDDVTFTLTSGHVTGLIGPNGAGKTSLIDALTGYTRPSGGRVVFQGADVTRSAPHRRARAGLSRTFQSVELFEELTVRENLLVTVQRVTAVSMLRDLVSHRRDDLDAVGWALQMTGLEEVADRYPAELSLGRAKLAGVARALATRPALLLLDEPAAGLDSEESLRFGERLRTIADAGPGILLVDHDMGLVLGTCDRVLVLDFGRLMASGTPDEIRNDSRVIAAYLGEVAG